MSARSGLCPQVNSHNCCTYLLSSDSAKLSLAIDNVLKPLVDAGGQYYGKVKVIMRLQVQPWHATSTYTHEAALAVSA
jgi:hypothetical protein